MLLIRQILFHKKCFPSFLQSSRFVLSGSLHGGLVMASYPFEDDSSYARSGDDALFRNLAQAYTENHPVMRTGNADCPDDPSKSSGDGIAAYLTFSSMFLTNQNSMKLCCPLCVHSGSMQDYNYLKGNCFEVSFELSCCKYPPASQLYTEWTNNREALLAFIQKVSGGSVIA